MQHIGFAKQAGVNLKRLDYRLLRSLDYLESLRPAAERASRTGGILGKYLPSAEREAAKAKALGRLVKLDRVIGKSRERAMRHRGELLWGGRSVKQAGLMRFDRLQRAASKGKRVSGPLSRAEGALDRRGRRFFGWMGSTARAVSDSHPLSPESNLAAYREHLSKRVRPALKGATRG